MDEQPPELIRGSRRRPARPARSRCVLDGRSTTVTVAEGDTVLDGAQRSRPTCRSPARAGCAARAGRGSSTARSGCARNFALEDAEVAARFRADLPVHPGDREGRRRLRRLGRRPSIQDGRRCARRRAARAFRCAASWGSRRCRRPSRPAPAGHGTSKTSTLRLSSRGTSCSRTYVRKCGVSRCASNASRDAYRSSSTTLRPSSSRR